MAGRSPPIDVLSTIYPEGPVSSGTSPPCGQQRLRRFGPGQVSRRPYEPWSKLREYVSIQMCVNMSMYVYIYICLEVENICVYMYIYTHMYVCICVCKG